MTRRNSVSSGERLTIPASEYNSLLKAERNLRFGGRQFAGGTIEELFPPLIIWIKNTTASKVPAFGVLGLDQPITAPSSSASAQATISFRSQIRFKGVSPSTSTPHYGKFAVLQEPAAAGRTVRAVLTGTTVALLNVTTESDSYADIAHAQTGYLTTNVRGSAHVIWKEPGTGLKWGVIRLGPPPPHTTFSANIPTSFPSSASTFQCTLNSGIDLLGGGEFTLATNIITCNKTGYYRLDLNANIIIDYIQNDSCTIDVFVQARDDSLAAWFRELGVITGTAYHPNVAEGAGGAPIHESAGGIGTFNRYLAGNQFRVVTEGRNVYSAFPSVAVGGSIKFTNL